MSLPTSLLRRLTGSEYVDRLSLGQMDVLAGAAPSGLRFVRYDAQVPRVFSTMGWEVDDVKKEAVYTLSLDTGGAVMDAFRVSPSSAVTTGLFQTLAGQVVLGAGSDSWRIYNDVLLGELLLQKWSDEVGRYVTHMAIGGPSSPGGGGSVGDGTVLVGLSPNARWRLSTDGSTGKLLIEKWSPALGRYMLQMDIASDD